MPMINFYNFCFLHINNFKSGDNLFPQEKIINDFRRIEKKFPEYEPREKVIKKLSKKI